MTVLHFRLSVVLSGCACITVFIVSLLAKTAASPLSSLLTVRRLTVSKQLVIKSLN